MCLAIPGKIKSIEPFKEGFMSMGKVELGGIVKEINLQLVPEAKENDYVLVHVGVAISIVDEEEAKSSLKFLEQMNELDELYNSPVGDTISQEELAKQGEVIITKIMS
jgi:hydrogenase expression/formation protein HypC